MHPGRSSNIKSMNDNRRIPRDNSMGAGGAFIILFILFAIVIKMIGCATEVGHAVMYHH
jgi:hypothetical protein